ncbi:MAG TPA: hypothetical protein VF230_09235 [Acidimicrobiales bacterium]
MGTIAMAGRTVDRARREAWALAGFGTWMIVGLFLDGWAHRESKPESFFSPWHGVLYSGFAAAVLWFAVQARRAGERSAVEDRAGTLGMALFAGGAIGDFVWHQVFGIEADLETLLSPTHLLLMTGGLLMLTAPIRWAWTSDDVGDRPTMGTFAPVLVGTTLTVSVVTFFFMYMSAAWPVAWDGSNQGQRSASRACWRAT